MSGAERESTLGPGWVPDYSVSIRDAASIAERIRRYAFTCSSEEELQEAIARVLKGEGLAFEREVPLSPKDRIDFVVNRVGIEIKTAFALNAVARQIVRYLGHEEIEALVLVTTRAQHRGMPGTMLGKTIHVVHIAPAFV